MSRRVSMINNRKMLKTEAGASDGVESTSSCNSSETRVVVDCKDESSCALALGEASPLQNVVILRNLFELCPTDLLAKCRLVCKQWHEESLLTWSKSFPLRFTLENGQIYMEYDGPTGVNGRWPSLRLSLESFLEYTTNPIHQFQGIPHCYIRLQNSIIDSDIENKKQFDIFWNALGSNLTILELKYCKFLDDDEFRRIIFTHCPKLERLIIDKCSFSTTRRDSVEQLDRLDCKEQLLEKNKNLKVLMINAFTENERKLPVSWLELFNHFPLMSSLTLCGQWDMLEEAFDSLIKAIQVIRKKERSLLPFKVFNIGPIHISTDPLYKQRLAILQELRLPLRRLLVQLEPGIGEVFSRDIVPFCTKTLKYLSLDGWFPTAPCSEFPFGHQLDNVTSLSIDNFPQCLEFLKYVPNLEELDVRGSREQRKMTISNTDILEPSHLKMTKLTKLTVYPQLDDDDIAKMQDWMPNITDLHVHLNDEQFGIVCKKWINLKQFWVSGIKLTDEGVVGKKDRTGTNITNLQNLEEFTFESDKLSRKSVFQGFLQLPLLRVLKQFVVEAEPVQWGERTKKALLCKNISLEGGLDYNWSGMWDDWGHRY